MCSACRRPYRMSYVCLTRTHRTWQWSCPVHIWSRIQYNKTIGMRHFGVRSSDTYKCTETKSRYAMNDFFLHFIAFLWVPEWGTATHIPIHSGSCAYKWNHVRTWNYEMPNAKGVAGNEIEINLSEWYEYYWTKNYYLCKLVNIIK